ncbi:MAG: hypothetical protein ACK458_16580 [Sphingobacteriales bacterium]|jgi:hypothetical protein
MIVFIYLVLISCFGQSSDTSLKSLDPTGTYKLGKSAEDKNGDVYGYYGELRVKKVDSSKILMCFYICKGAPSYNSGSFVDTLSYNNMTASYRYADDSTCTVTFQFEKKGVDVSSVQDDLNFGCGFGHGVLASGYFKKISHKEPDIVDLTNGE